ncbi:MAG: hypothetical protein WCB27_08365 [Thermoguttaceae bacterium]
MVRPEEQIGLTLLGRYRVKRHRGDGCDGCLFVVAPTDQGLLGYEFGGKVDAANVMLEVIPKGRGYDPRQVDDLATIQPHSHLLRCQEIGLIGDGDLTGASYVVWETWDNTLAGVLARRTTMDEPQIRAMATEIAAALARYHSDNRVHGDVRAERICQVDGHWKLAPVLRRTANGGGADGAVAVTPQDDIHALGLVLLCCLSPKFASLREKAPSRPASQVEIEQALRDLPGSWQHWLRRCLAANPCDRCSGAELALMGADVPPPLATVSVDGEAGQYRLQWEPADGRQVQVYRWLGRGRCPAQGDIWLFADLKRIAENVPLDTPTTARVQLQPRTACQVIVATIVGEAAVIGDSITLTWAADVDHLKIVVEGKAITATWDWPAGASDTQVVVREGAFPTGPDDPHRLGSYRCFRAGYMPAGRFTIPIDRRAGIVHVTVYAKYAHDDGWELASGRTTGARAAIALSPNIRLHYRVEKISLLARLLLRSEPCRLSLRADQTAALPELTLVLGESSTPFDAGSGLPILQVPARQYEQGVVVQKDFRPPDGMKIENTRLLFRGKVNNGVRLIPERGRTNRVSG